MLDEMTPGQNALIFAIFLEIQKFGAILFKIFNCNEI